MPPELTSTRRPLTPKEQAVLDETNRRWASRREALISSPWELGAPGLAFSLVGGVLWAFGFGPGPWIAIPGVFAVLAAVALHYKNQSFEIEPGRHYEASEAIEYTLRAKRVVFTIDDRGDGQLYALFEITDGRWHLLVDELLPFMDTGLLDVLAHQAVRWSETNTGLPLLISGEGAAIPRHGVLDDTMEAIDVAIDAGFCWSPDIAEDAFVAEQLPPWMTDWSLTPPSLGDPDA